MPCHAVAPIKRPPPPTGGCCINTRSESFIPCAAAEYLAALLCPQHHTHPHCAGRVQTTHAISNHTLTQPSGVYYYPQQNTPECAQAAVLVRSSAVKDGWRPNSRLQLLTLGACRPLPAAASAADQVAAQAALTGAACARPAQSSAAQTRWSRGQRRPAHRCSHPRRQTGAR